MERENVQSPHGAAIESKREDGRGHRPEEAISKSAEELGVSKDTVARAVAAESLPQPVKDAADNAGLGTMDRVRVIVREIRLTITASIAPPVPPFC
jgi:hypothetical protein